MGRVIVLGNEEQQEKSMLCQSNGTERARGVGKRQSLFPKVGYIPVIHANGEHLP